jgi:hypothetical protein
VQNNGVFSCLPNEQVAFSYKQILMHCIIGGTPDVSAQASSLRACLFGFLRSFAVALFVSIAALHHVFQRGSWLDKNVY